MTARCLKHLVVFVVFSCNLKSSDNCRSFHGLFTMSHGKVHFTSLYSPWFCLGFGGNRITGSLDEIILLPIVMLEAWVFICSRHLTCFTMCGLSWRNNLILTRSVAIAMEMSLQFNIECWTRLLLKTSVNFFMSSLAIWSVKLMANVRRWCDVTKFPLSYK